ncbi:C40 family peptidase [Taibaiella lutea]|nr:C40 family peptidase [Taibaiella lutea]
MKQITTILSTCIALMFLGSCAAQKTTGSTASKSKTPQFIDGITLEGGSNNVRLTQGKQLYTNNKKANNDAPDMETAEQKSTAFKKISEGKKHNISLYSFIEDWYGTPYRFGGDNRFGIDCSAFTRQLYNDVYNLPIVRTSIEQFTQVERIATSELKEGDLVFFKIHSKRISHVGVYLYDGKFVHASVSQGVVISDLGDAYWTRYYAGGGRMNHI